MGYDIIDRVKKMYDERVITPEIGSGKLRQTLLDGLESVLREVQDQLPPTQLPNEVLDRKIDYQAIFKLEKENGYKYRASRLRNGLKYSLNVKTYRDLVNHAKDKLKTGGRAVKINGVRVLGFGRYVSFKSTILLYQHLNSLGINLFEDGYTRQELGK